MDYVCIDRLEEGHLSARTLAVYYDGRVEDNVSYTLRDTPCGDVVGKSVCVFQRGVRHQFPDDAVLQEMSAESYVGVTLWSSAGRPNGLIALDQPKAAGRSLPRYRAPATRGRPRGRGTRTAGGRGRAPPERGRPAADESRTARDQRVARGAGAGADRRPRAAGREASRAGHPVDAGRGPGAAARGRTDRRSSCSNCCRPAESSWSCSVGSAAAPGPARPCHGWTASSRSRSPWRGR